MKRHLFEPYVGDIELDVEKRTGGGFHCWFCSTLIENPEHVRQVVARDGRSQKPKRFHSECWGDYLKATNRKHWEMDL